MPELRLDNSIVDDRYHVERCLSRGSYAEIFLAADGQFGGLPVIIKALNTSLQGTPDPELEQTLIENFQNEAVALDKVLHPNIIRRLGHGTAADLESTPFHYLVVEYMAGGDLLALCRTKPFDLNEVLLYFRQVADALDYAHSKQVIHRDIKPTNLLLSADRLTVKIADFGVAKILVQDCREITRVGTHIYAAPEHHPDNQGCDDPLTPSADVYSLAKTIYTAVTGRAPHSFARMPISDWPDHMSLDGWTKAILPVLAKATSARVSDRYPNVREFWNAFEAATGPASTEADPEATRVRSRPKLEPAPQPRFNDAYAAHPQQARIVIELPRAQPEPESYARPDGPDVATAAIARRHTAVMFDNDGKAHHPEGSAVEVGNQTAPLVNTGPGKVIASVRAREIDWNEWLRRAFLIFIAAAFVGVVVSIYHYFADPTHSRPLWQWLPFVSSVDGTISGASNVNLRSEPNGSVQVWLPEGTRVRVEETRGEWLKVRVIEWAGGQPDGAPQTGWVGRRYVDRD